MNGINVATDICIKYILLGSSSLSHPVNWDWNGNLFVKIVIYNIFSNVSHKLMFLTQIFGFPLSHIQPFICVLEISTYHESSHFFFLYSFFCASEQPLMLLAFIYCSFHLFLIDSVTVLLLSI